MVPKVAGKGRSFVGAGLYYLHDKKASTSERVAFIHTENLPTRDPDKAIKCMAWSAMRQQELKARAGGSAKGRKLEQPVYCYSLSWSPGEEPSHAEMLGAAMDTVKALGLDGHEALFVVHNDEPHPHIHVIVNRVHPETGIAAKLSKDHLKLSAWAEEFERRQGQIRCEQRVENNERRRNGEFVKDRDSQHAAEFHRWRQERASRQTHRRAVESAALDARHEREREQLRAARDRRIEERRLRVKQATRADWRDLYAVQGQERRRLDAAQRNVWARLRFFVRTHGEEFRAAGPAARKQMLKGAFAALIGSRRQYGALDRKQKADRTFFADRLKARTEALTRAIRKDHDRRLADLRERQSAERRDLQSRQSAQSQEEAREIREGRDEEIYRKEQEEKRRQELKETKEGILKKPPQAAKKPTLLDRFNAASREKAQKEKENVRSAHGGKQTAPREQKPSRAGKETSAQRAAAFREQAKDTTEKKKKPTQGRESMSEKFRKARDATSNEKPAPQRRVEFRENANDASRDVGRSRTRTIKPPGGRKPD
ncbi:MAG: relaxase/mobilization nuclease domain-containing protein [Verrucomicrobiales bacterium]|nr:relaxase/mobilization nuclease domain-containing protein [Verrucomicrobiales bacterium]